MKLGDKQKCCLLLCELLSQGVCVLGGLMHVCKHQP